MLITDEYRKLNEQLHKDREDYGRSGQKWAAAVAGLCISKGVNQILDYGCGKQTLSQALPQFSVTGYDPAVPGLDSPPEAHDVVTCTDVLEHIEPALLDNVLDDLKRLGRVACFLTIATRPAVKTLADGRNAHLIVESYRWWLNKILARWDIEVMHVHEGEVMIITKPIEGAA